MGTGDERVGSELQNAMEALTKASGHLDRAAQASTASGLSQGIAAANGLLKDLQQEVSYLMRRARSGG
jgi:hypothetical protein